MERGNSGFELMSHGFDPKSRVSSSDVRILTPCVKLCPDWWTVLPCGVSVCPRGHVRFGVVQAAMELFLRTSGAGRSWVSPSVFWTVARTPRIWRAACETGEGVQAASWPLILNVGAMVRMRRDEAVLEDEDAAVGLHYTGARGSRFCTIGDNFCLNLHYHWHPVFESEKKIKIVPVTY